MLSIKQRAKTFFECLPSYNEGYLEVGDGHSLYYEEYGNPNGRPVLFLHGGPGAGFSNSHKGFFDPKTFRVIFYDQRGSGKSIPYAEIKNNTTELLLSDIECLRNFLKIDSWLLFGGSWGSTLALLYGIKYPERCKGFILRGIFLGSRKEVNWFLYDINRFFPEAYNKFISYVPKTERDNILNWFYSQLNAKDRSANLKAASVWAEYENSCSSLEYVERPISGENALAISRIEAHYFINDCFISKNFIINNISKISHIPAIIVQGRHDVICPPFSAMNLSKEWESSELQIVDDAGHSAFEHNIGRKIINALHMIK
ncbi:MAG: prolyl aminopeptidase [Proteobacteria bacterium]|jgi:proline iminopeptidase|nr:prolyl aminopeptidase [Pseudomonadota bacterium]